MAAAALDADGVKIKEAMQGRISTLAKVAAVAEVRLMIDAEQSWLQPAIDNTVYSLQVWWGSRADASSDTYRFYSQQQLS